MDQKYVSRFAACVREIFPYCPDRREVVIAEHAWRKYTGRVGRSAAAKALEQDAVRTAVTAHIRHAETEYDELLLLGLERWDAREEVHAKVNDVLAKLEFGDVDT